MSKSIWEKFKREMCFIWTRITKIFLWIYCIVGELACIFCGFISGYEGLNTLLYQNSYYAGYSGYSDYSVLQNYHPIRAFFVWLVLTILLIGSASVLGMFTEIVTYLRKIEENTRIANETK